MDCPYQLTCLNNTKCYKCFDLSMLKLPKEKKSSHKQKEVNYADANKSDSWKDLEQRVADRLNQIPSAKEARRSRMSGALPFEKGDIVDDILMPECKERIGNVAADGAVKSFTIKREWLEKAKNEADEKNRTMTLPFRFKGDENIYTVTQFEDIATLVTMYKSVEKTNRILEAQNHVLREKLKQYQKEEGSDE